MPMTSLDHARERFLRACAALDALEKRTYAIGWMRDDGSAWNEHQRALQIARHVKRESFEELQLAKIACPPRSRPVKLR